MRLQVFVDTDGDAPDELWSLQDWLRHEPALARDVRTVAGGPQAGDLGFVTDHLDVILGSGGAVAVLAASLKTWFAQPRRSDIKITIREPGGRTVTVDAKRVSDVEGLLHQVVDPDAGGSSRAAS